MLEIMENKNKPDTGRRYTSNHRDLAYQLWAFVCNRSAEKVSAEMLSGNWGDSVDITSRTIRNWATDEKWEERVREDMQRIAPDIRAGIMSELLLSGKEAAEYVRGVIRGSESPEKTRATVSLAVLGMLGFTQQPKEAPLVALQTGKSSDALPDLSKLSADELNALEAKYRSKK